METRQRRVLDSFERVRTFLAEHPASGTLTYTSAREMLEDVITRLRALASTQYLGRAQSRAETRRQADRADALLSEFIRPIVSIARAQLEPTSDVGLPAGLRMPKLPLNPSQLRTVCDGMTEAAREHEALQIEEVEARLTPLLVYGTIAGIVLKLVINASLPQTIFAFLTLLLLAVNSSFSLLRLETSIFVKSFANHE